MRIAFVTHAAQPELVPDDRIAAAELGRRGARVEAIPWSAAGVAWSGFDAVVVRSAWDYHLRPAEFRRWLEARAADGTRLANPAATILWNSHKGYLLELERLGVAIVPTRLVPAGRSDELAAALAALPAAIVKPAVSASAHGTHRVDGGRPSGETLTLAAAHDVLVQPFLPEIAAGEWSLIFFGGAFSHAVLKSPKAGDFRVQAEHGGAAAALVPDAPLIASAGSALAAVPGAPPLYARIDGVVRAGTFLLMEIELIEPQLYFANHPEAARRFADALADALLAERPSRIL
jgi:glutathione synthase/RimK-type ligase-like ATP-grasp enzyme